MKQWQLKYTPLGCVKPKVAYLFPAYGIHRTRCMTQRDGLFSQAFIT